MRWRCLVMRAVSMHGTTKRQVGVQVAELTGGHLPLCPLPLSKILEHPGFSVRLHLLMVVAAQLILVEPGFRVYITCFWSLPPSMTVRGSTTFPMDLDILIPRSSSRKPGKQLQANLYA